MHKHLLHLEMQFKISSLHAQVEYTYIPGKCIVPSTAVVLVVSLFHTRAMLEGQQSAVSTLQDQECKTRELDKVE